MMDLRISGFFGAVVAAWASLTLAGCSASGQPENQVPVAFYITDDFRSDYSTSVVGVQQIQVTTSAGLVSTPFESTRPLEVDVRSLGGDQPLFAGLAVLEFPSGEITRLELLIQDFIRVVEAKTGAEKKLIVNEGLRAGPGLSKLTVNFDPPINFSSGSRKSFTLDFDLSQWSVSGSTVMPVIKEYTGGGLDDPSRHVRTVLRGSVVSAGDVNKEQVFTIQPTGSPRILSCQFGSRSVLYDFDDVSMPRIVPQARVAIRGYLDSATQMWMADSVGILASLQPDELDGLAAVVDSTPNLLILRKIACQTPDPDASLFLKANITGETALINGDGLRVTPEEFLEEIAPEDLLWVRGARASGSNDFDLYGAVQPPDSDPTDRLYRMWGGLIQPNLDGSPVEIDLERWQGFHATPGMRVTVDHDEMTEYFNRQREKVSKVQFMDDFRKDTRNRLEIEADKREERTHALKMTISF